MKTQQSLKQQPWYLGPQVSTCLQRASEQQNPLTNSLDNKQLVLSCAIGDTVAVIS